MLSREEFVEAARASGVSQGAVDEILRCLRPCVVINRDKVGEPVGRWEREEEMVVFVDCAALPDRHLDLGLGLPGSGSLVLGPGVSPRWLPGSYADELTDSEESGELHAYAAWTLAEWYTYIEDSEHPATMHPALEEAMAEYRRCHGPMELLNKGYFAPDRSLQLGGAMLVFASAGPLELEMIDVDDDWDWKFTDEIVRKASFWRLFAHLHHDSGFEYLWLVHREDTAVERYHEIVWMEHLE
ncbi:hypothetical protein MUK60_42285 [Streptomyces sp. LRE541]|uniref:hypothetical protein n=1 Tax=Streptomyces sp. LRE541 TaxID=2931983 RepID=UPI0020107FCB|nr:hypothetical protein [Streptomyces sp. LRE541]UPZ33852.1 hypothetical protein MUK60_42285 [Streptomyces sp. LRE541]